MATAVKKSLENLAEGLRCLFAGYTYPERDYFIVTVDSSKHANCVLSPFGTDLPDDVVGEVIADCLPELLEVLFHLRAYYD